MPRIVHAADIHLDSPLQGLGRLGDAGLAEELRSATRRAYDNLVRCCIDERADLLVIAGDIYDGDWDSYETGVYFVRGLHQLRDSGIEVALLYGNHDAESSITKRLTLPDGVHVFGTAEPGWHVFEDLGVVVHGQSYAIRDVTQNLVQRYSKRRDGYVNVGMLHTGLQGVAGHARYAPCTVKDITSCEYEYFALGHVHHRGKQAGGDNPAWFSGNLQGRHSRETGPKGALIVDVEPDGPARVGFAECDVARWEVLEPDLSGCEDVDDVVAGMNSAYQQALGQAGDRPVVVRFNLIGRTAAAGALAADPDRLLAEAQSFIRAGGAVDKVRLDVAPPVDSPSLDPEMTAQLIRATQDLAGEPDTVRELLADLRRFGFWRLTDGTDVDLDDDDSVRALVERAGRRLTSNLGA